MDKPIDAEDIAVLLRLQAALPDVGLNGWFEGVQVLARVIEHLTAAQQQGQAVAWFPTNAQGEIIRNYGDGSPVYACRTKEEAEQAKRCHLGATGPVIPLYTAQQSGAVAPTTAECPHDWGQDEAHEDWVRCYKCGISRRKPLAQHPAAVDEAMVERAWVAFCENNGSARQGIRAALIAAAQPGGSDNDR